MDNFFGRTEYKYSGTILTKHLVTDIFSIISCNCVLLGIAFHKIWNWKNTDLNFWIFVMSRQHSQMSKILWKYDCCIKTCNKDVTQYETVCRIFVLCNIFMACFPLKKLIVQLYHLSILESQWVNIYTNCGRNNHISSISPKKLVQMKHFFKCILFFYCQEI